MSRLLIPEIGLPDTRRGRRWLAIFRVLSDEGGPQEKIEAAAWELLSVLDAGARAARERRLAVVAEEIRRAFGGRRATVDHLAAEVERVYRETR